MEHFDSIDWAEFWLCIDYFQWVGHTTPDYVHRNVLRSRATFESFVRMRASQGEKGTRHG